tara:strand:- start:1239 stop:1544 length:306 start_codon:yes stop_codon:yes gene_type:complete
MTENKNKKYPYFIEIPFPIDWTGWHPDNSKGEWLEPIGTIVIDDNKEAVEWFTYEVKSAKNEKEVKEMLEFLPDGKYVVLNDKEEEWQEFINQIKEETEKI